MNSKIIKMQANWHRIPIYSKFMSIVNDDGTESFLLIVNKFNSTIGVKNIKRGGGDTPDTFEIIDQELFSLFILENSDNILKLDYVEEN